METKQTMRNIRLLLGASDAHESQVAIAPEFVPQIEQARSDLASMRGSDVINALLVLNKAGISLALDVRRRVAVSGKVELSRPPEHRRG